MRKTELRLFTIADYEEEEIWLREQHRSGWKLVKMTPPLAYVFESCEPEDVIYRLDYKNAQQTEEYLQMLKDFGWEYFAHCMGWLYFRKPAAAAETEEDGELFSDGASRVELVSSIVKTRLLPMCLIFLFFLLPSILNLTRLTDFGAGGRIVSAVFGVVFGALFGFYVFFITYCGIKLKKLRDRFEAK